MTRQTRFRSAARRAGIIGAIMALALLTVAVGAPLVLRGERFGRIVVRNLPRFRGQITVGGGRWSWGAVLALLRERPAAITLEDVRITDPEGTPVLRLGRISAEVELHRAPQRLVVRGLIVEDADWRYAPMNREKKIGFLAAFEGVSHPGGTQGAGPPSAVEASIVDARLEGVTATFDLPSWGLALRDVHGAAALAMRGSGVAPAVLTFEVRQADARGGGRLRILDGRGSFALPMSHARLDRVATTTDASDSIRIAASQVVTGRSTLALAGTFDGIYGNSPASRAPGLALTGRFDDAADAIVALARSAGLGGLPDLGPRAQLDLHLDGPFARLRVATTLTSSRLGRLAADATLETSRIAGGLTFGGFELGFVVPAPLAPFASGTLDGTLRGAVGFDGAVSLDELSLVLTRPAGRGGPRVVRARAGATPSGGPSNFGGWGLDLSGIRYVAGTFELPRLAFGLFGGRVAASGRLSVRDPRAGHWLADPILELSLRADELSMEALLGIPYVKGRSSFRAHVRGSLHELTLELDLPPDSGVTVLGERLGFPSRLTARLADGALSFDSIRLAGPGGSAFEASGRVALPQHLDLGIVVRDFPIGRLPGLVQTKLPLAGRISGKMQLAAGTGAPDVSGQVSFDAVTFAGRRLGGGELAITPSRGGAIRAHGRLIEGVTVDGTLTPASTGLAGQASLTIDKVALDPFMPTLPGGARVAGTVSGRVDARIVPGRPAFAQGRLSPLTLVITPPGPATPPTPPSWPYQLVADGDIPFSVQSGGGPLEIGPARFRGEVGAFSLSVESRDDDLRGTLRGRIDAGALAPLAGVWLDRLAGAVDVDLAVGRRGRAVPPSLEGSVTIATPVSFRPTGLPIDARVPSGRILFRGTTAETTGLPVTLHAEQVAGGMIRQLEASAHVDGRVVDAAGALPAPLRASARATFDQLTAVVPAIGSQPIVCAPATLAIESRGDTIDVTEIDVPARGEARGMSAAGAHVDRATFGLRLYGDPRRRLTLSGDVDLLAAHASAQALAAAAKETKGGSAGGRVLWADHPEIGNTELDVRLRSHGGAVAVDVPKVPDLRVDVDLHVGGTVKRPLVSGGPKGANLYSSFMLLVGRLFR